MPNKKAENYSNFNRVLLLTMLKEKPMTIAEMTRKLEMVDRRAVYHHLEFLEKRGLIKHNNPAEHTRGKPVKWECTSKAKPIPKPILKWANAMFKFRKQQLKILDNK